MTVLNSPNPGEANAAVTLGTTYNLARALWIGTGGNVNVMNSDGTTQIFYNVPTGFMLPVRSIGVSATNTTASNIVAVY